MNQYNYQTQSRECPPILSIFQKSTFLTIIKPCTKHQLTCFDFFMFIFEQYSNFFHEKISKGRMWGASIQVTRPYKLTKLHIKQIPTGFLEILISKLIKNIVFFSQGNIYVQLFKIKVLNIKSKGNLNSSYF